VGRKVREKGAGDASMTSSYAFWVREGGLKGSEFVAL
jgi:hypothetical protein